MVAMQTYVYGALAALGAAAAALQVATGHLGLAVVFVAGALDFAARAQ